MMAWATRPVTSTKARSPNLRLVRSRRVANCVANSKIKPGLSAAILAKARIGHFGQFRLLARAYPRAARRLFIEQAHLAEELALVQIRQNHFVPSSVLDS